MRRWRQAHRNLQLDAAAAITLIVKMSRFATAVEQHKSARKTEQQGYPMTAAFQWRKAAAMFSEDDALEDRCWCEWERLMRLPRRLSAAM